MDTILDGSDIAYMAQGWRTIWQANRMRVGDPVAQFLRPTFDNVDPVGGTYDQTLTVILADHPVYFAIVPDEQIASMGGLYLPGTITVEAYDTGGKMEETDLLYIDGRLWRIYNQRYKASYLQWKAVLFPYSEALSGITVVTPSGGGQTFSHVKVENGQFYMLDTVTATWRQVRMSDGVLTWE